MMLQNCLEGDIAVGIVRYSEVVFFESLFEDFFQ